MYLAMTDYVAIASLIREDETVQWSIYYVSKRLSALGTRYKIEKGSFLPIHGSSKTSIVVLSSSHHSSNQPAIK